MKLNRSARLSLAVPVLALALTGCSGSDEPSSQAGSTPTTPQVSTPVSTPQATSTPAATSTSRSTPAVAKRLPGWPEAALTKLDSPSPVAIVATDKQANAEFDKAWTNLRAAGYDQAGYANCYKGAAKVAGLPGADEDYEYVVVGFRTEADAKVFATRYQEKFGTAVAGVGLVTDLCPMH